MASSELPTVGSQVANALEAVSALTTILQDNRDLGESLGLFQLPMLQANAAGDDPAPEDKLRAMYTLLGIHLQSTARARRRC